MKSSEIFDKSNDLNLSKTPPPPHLVQDIPISRKAPVTHRYGKVGGNEIYFEGLSLEPIIILFFKDMASASGTESNLDATRRQVDEVQNIMKANVEKVLERDGKLGQLEERADRLQEGTEQFHRSAGIS